MSEAKIVFTKDAPFPVGPYSQAVIAGNTVYCSGQIPLTPAGELLPASASITENTELVLSNLAAVLKEAGSSIAKVVKVNAFITDMAHFAEMNAVYEKVFTHKPARSCVAVHQLPKGVLVEIEAIALI